MKLLPALFTAVSSAAIALSAVSGFTVLRAADAPDDAESTGRPSWAAEAEARRPSLVELAGTRVPEPAARLAQVAPTEAAVRSRARQRALAEQAAVDVPSVGTLPLHLSGDGLAAAAPPGGPLSAPHRSR
ncbi:MAG: hypothetical protein AAFU73_02170 [Planctomycetota bacterium]